MLKRLLFIVFFISATIFSGCTTRMLDFTVISSKTFDLSQMKNFKRGTGRVKGEDTAYMILIFPLGTPDMKEAVDRAIEGVPGAVGLVDGVLYNRGIFFVLGALNSYIVEGTPLIDPKLISKIEIKSPYMISYFDAKLKKQKLKYVSKNTYQEIKTYIANGKMSEVTRILEQKKS